MNALRTTAVILPLILILSCTLGATPLQLTGTSGEVNGGEHIGPYFVSVAGGVPQAMVCDDLFISIGIGQVWDATKLGWDDLTSLEQAKYGVAYWLTNSILDNPAPYADAQWALWRLFSPSAPLPGASATMLAWANSQYVANPGWFDYNYLVVWRPDPRSSSQEFLTITDTPELNTLTYLGSGLMLVLLPGLRRRLCRRRDCLSRAAN